MMSFRKRLESLVAILVIALPTSVSAGVVDFEDAGSWGGDDTAIVDAYFDQFGIQISGRAGKNERKAADVVFAFEATGRDGTDAFWTRGSGRDKAFSGDLGNYLLKAGAGDLSYNKAKYFSMTVDYNNPTQALSGEIWDIDGPEKYRVTAKDAFGNGLARLDSPSGGLDGEPWSFSFDLGQDLEIAQIEIEAIGTGKLRGFAFDNFNSVAANANAISVAAPIPSAFPLGLFGMAIAGFLRRRRT